MSILDDIKNMTPEERKSLADLLKNSGLSLDIPETDGKIENSEKPKRGRKKKIADEPIEKPTNKKKPLEQGRRESRLDRSKDIATTKGKNIRRDGGGGKHQARIVPINITGENKFLKMAEARQHKEDRDIDKKLWKNRQPSERRGEVDLVEVQCNKCNRYFDVSPSMIYVEDGVANFTCNKCSRKH